MKGALEIHEKQGKIRQNIVSVTPSRMWNLRICKSSSELKKKATNWTRLTIGCNQTNQTKNLVVQKSGCIKSKRKKQKSSCIVFQKIERPLKN